MSSSGAASGPEPDSFVTIREELVNSLNQVRSLFTNWGQGEEEVRTELRNALRSMEWDLEDLEELLSLVENNEKKFKISPGEVKSRRDFINSTRSEVMTMKSSVNEAIKLQSPHKKSTHFLDKSPSLIGTSMDPFAEPAVSSTPFSFNPRDGESDAPQERDIGLTATGSRSPSPPPLQLPTPNYNRGGPYNQTTVHLSPEEVDPYCTDDQPIIQVPTSSLDFVRRKVCHTLGLTTPLKQTIASVVLLICVILLFGLIIRFTWG